MPRLNLTDLTVRALRGSDKYVTYWDTAIPGFGVRVGKRSKTWVVLRGRHRERISIGKFGSLPYAEARREAMRLLSEISDTPKTKPVSITIKDARREFLEEHYRGSTTSWPRSVQLILDASLKAIDYKPLRNLGDVEIQAILTRLSNRPSAQLHTYRVLRTFLKWCTRPPRRYLTHSPMEGYSAPGKDRKGTRILTDEELRAVWNVTGQGNRQAVRLMILWGTRNTETCGIRRSWRQGDLLTIPGSHTKNGRDHGIPVLPLAADILTARPHYNDFYFPGRYEKRPLNSYALNRMMTAVKEESGTTGWQLRDIRRTFRSNMARLRVPREVCEVLINHAPPILDEIYDRYDRLDEKREALAKYEDFLRDLLGEKRTVPARADGEATLITCSTSPIVGSTAGLCSFSYVGRATG